MKIYQDTNQLQRQYQCVWLCPNWSPPPRSDIRQATEKNFVGLHRDMLAAALAEDSILVVDTPISQLMASLKLLSSRALGLRYQFLFMSGGGVASSDEADLHMVFARGTFSLLTRRTLSSFAIDPARMVLEFAGSMGPVLKIGGRQVETMDYCLLT